MIVERIPSQDDYKLLRSVLKDNKTLFDRLEREKRELEKRMEQVARMIRIGEESDKIIRGVPVKIWTHEVWGSGSFDYEVAGLGTNNRRAKIWLNASTRDLPPDQRRWGLSLHEGYALSGAWQESCGSNWPSRKLVVMWANRWVVSKMIPPEKLRYYSDSGRRNG